MELLYWAVGAMIFLVTIVTAFYLEETYRYSGRNRYLVANIFATVTGIALIILLAVIVGS